MSAVDRAPGSGAGARAPETQDGRGERLSALADGQLTPEEAARAVADWAEDATARQAWHAYHLTGDVLRSEELAPAPGHDEQFLSGLRERLDAEPAVLAPAPWRARRSAWRPWRAPAAAAAGVVAVAGVVWTLQGLMPGAGEPASGAAGSTALTLPAPGGGSAVGAPAGQGVVPVAQGGEPAAAAPADPKRLLRDPRLDEALRAQAASAAGPAGTVRRQIETVSAPR